MRNILIGLLIGLILAAGITIYLPKFFVPNSSPASQLKPTNTITSGAGTDQNYAHSLSNNQIVSFSLGIADSALGTTLTTSDLSSLQITLSKAEAHLVQTNDKLPLPLGGRWEILNLTRPSIELFALRGGGGMAEVGRTNLALGSYDNLKLTISGIKGRDSTGQIIDIPIDQADRVIEIKQSLLWNQIGQDIQLVLDLDSLSSITQSGTNYQFKPIIRRLIQNDQVLTGISKQ